MGRSGAGATWLCLSELPLAHHPVFRGHITPYAPALTATGAAVQVLSALEPWLPGTREMAPAAPSPRGGEGSQNPGEGRHGNSMLKGGLQYGPGCRTLGWEPGLLVSFDSSGRGVVCSV